MSEEENKEPKVESIESKPSTDSIPENVIETVEPKVEPVVEPIVEPKVEEKPAEPEPAWMNRKYIRRAFNFEFEGATIEGNFYDIGEQRVDIDGLYNTTEYNNLTELATIANLNPEQNTKLVNKVQKLFSEMKLK